MNGHFSIHNICLNSLMPRGSRSIKISFLFVPVILFLSGAFQTVVAENIIPANNYTVTAVSEGNTININWVTSIEINSDYFIIQRSKDGIIFDDVMQEIAAGNSSVVNNYSITDYRPYAGTSFYRVVEVDVDGNLINTGLTVANFEMELSMNVYSGSAANTFSVSISAKDQKQVLLVVRDMQGKEFFSKFIILRSVDEIVAIDPEGKLPQGIYTIVASSNNAIFSKKVMITK